MRSIIVILLVVFICISPVFAQTSQTFPVIALNNVDQVRKVFRFAFNDLVLDLEWSPDGKYLAISGTMPTIIRDIAAKTNIAILEDSASGITWSPDGNYLAAIARGDYKDRLVIWNTTTWEKIHESAIPIFSWYIAWSPDNKFLAASLGDRLAIWKLTETTPPKLSVYWELETVASIEPLSWSPDGRYLAIYKAHQHDTDYYILDVPSKSFATKLSGFFTTAVWSPIDDKLALMDWKILRLFDMAKQSALFASDSFPGSPYDLAWSPNGSLIAVTISAQSNDHTLRIVDANNGKELKSLLGHTNSVEEVDWSPDGTQIASGDRDGNIIIWAIGD